MCYISLTLKYDSGETEERKVKLSSSQLVSLETPYYVVIEVEKEKLSLSYVYSDNSTNTRKRRIGDADVIYGDNTGRVFHVEVIGSLRNIKSIDLDELLIDEWTDVKRNNFKLGMVIYNVAISMIVSKNKITKTQQ